MQFAFETAKQSKSQRLKELDLDENLQFVQPLISVDFKNQTYRIAMGYSHRVEDERGWETATVWRIEDLFTGNEVDSWWYGSADPSGYDGNRKRTPDEIQSNEDQKKRGRSLLKEFEKYSHQ